METRQGKIEEKSLKFAANKAAYATFKIDGRNYNTFDKEIIDNHNPDDFVEFTGEMRGKFWTMETMNKIDKLDPHPESEFAKEMAKNGAKEYHLSPEEVKCRALECAIEVCKDKKIMDGEQEPKQLTSKHYMTMADQFVEWIYGN